MSTIAFSREFLILAAAPPAPPRFDVSSEPSILFQIVLTVSLLGVGLYSIALRRKIALLGNLAAIVTVVGMIFVWHPTIATAFAARLGIGRGADLIFYCWVVISMLMILNLHLKIRIQAETVTELVRQLAIAQPFSVPDGDIPPSPPGGESAEQANRNADDIQ